jgi:hypothetical protein
VDGLPEQFNPRLIEAKGAAIMVSQDEETTDWLGSQVPTPKAWEGSRLKIEGLDVLATYKRLVAWFPGHVKDMECYFQQLHRLNWGIDTGHWRVQKCRDGLPGDQH